MLLIVGMGSNGRSAGLERDHGNCTSAAQYHFHGYSAISVSEDKGKINPIFLNAVQMFFGGLLIYMIGLGTEGYHSFIGKPGRILYQSFYSGIYLGLCFQFLVYRLTE